MKACGLSVSYLPPNRRTLDRRLKTIYTDIKERISTMGNLFVIERLVRPYVVATDTALLRSKGKVLHRSSMKRCSTSFRNRYRCKVGSQSYQRMDIWI
jgi:hypothetical protein